MLSIGEIHLLIFITVSKPATPSVVQVSVVEKMSEEIDVLRITAVSGERVERVSHSYRLVPLSLQRLFHVTEQFLFLRYFYILFDVKYTSFSVMMTIGN